MYKNIGDAVRFARHKTLMPLWWSWFRLCKNHEPAAVKGSCRGQEDVGPAQSSGSIQKCQEL